MNTRYVPSAVIAAESPLSTAACHRFVEQEGAPWLLGDWDDAVFFHYSIAPATLQPFVPVELDRFSGEAFVSLVAFTMRGMRLARGGKCSAWLCRPMREQRFLNLRTYVRHGAETGIFFLNEWISHWLCAQLGPPLYGLPYRWRRLNCAAAPTEGRVEARDGATGFAWRLERPARLAVCEPASVDEFLLERYTAFTGRGSTRRFFRIWHAPWPQARVEVVRLDETLPASAAPWWPDARFLQAHHSPGARDIWMGRPKSLQKIRS